MDQQYAIAQQNDNGSQIRNRTTRGTYLQDNRALGTKNKTGLPNDLKSGIENLSGISMDDVKVHYNSSRPAQLNAHAYAQGSHIHIAPGQQKHLAHEAWHVVQQKQGRVRPTQYAMKAINDDVNLEREADTMGAKALIGLNEDKNRKARPGKSFKKAYSIKSPSSVAQRKISFKSGRFKNRASLIKALTDIFPKRAHRRIRNLVMGYEVQRWTIYGSSAYREIIKTLKSEGYRPMFATITNPSRSRHGPMLPDRVKRDADVNPGAAISTFNFPSVTLGRLTLMSERIQASFHDRQVDANFHAEDGLMQQLEEYLAAAEINPAECAINLTINNFFCSGRTTTKSKKSQNCLSEIIALHKKYGFARFHVYFQNPYGPKALMNASIQRLQEAGILVSPFTTTEDPPYHNPLLDAASESDRESGDEEKETGDSGSKSRKRKMVTDKASYKEQRFLTQLLSVNNCLINAIARPGLGRNANFEELVTIRQIMRDRGFEIGEMLVASPAIIRIILQCLGINRGVRVTYRDPAHPDDVVAGRNTIIIDHDNDHFQERR